MKDLVRYRAMESLCRQRAVFRPLESWRLLAEAEMWHHKAEDEMAARSMEREAAPTSGALARRFPRSSQQARARRWRADECAASSMLASQGSPAGISLRIVVVIPKGEAMKLVTITFATILMLRRFRLRTMRRAKRPGFHVGRSRRKFRRPGTSPTTGSSMKPSRKRHVDLGRQRRQWRPGQGQDARQQSGREAAQQAEQAGQNVGKRFRLRPPVTSSRPCGDRGHDRSGWPAGRRPSSGFPAARPPPGSRR